MSDLREEDHKAMIKLINDLDNKKLICKVEKCEKEASAIIQRNPLCADHGLEYLKSKK